MKELQVCRTITVEIFGDKSIVDELARDVGMKAFCDSRVRVRLTQREDFLDADGKIIPPKEIVAALESKALIDRVAVRLDEAE
jgi:hypothetical protein